MPPPHLSKRRLPWNMRNRFSFIYKLLILNCLALLRGCLPNLSQESWGGRKARLGATGRAPDERISRTPGPRIGHGAQQDMNSRRRQGKRKTTSQGGQDHSRLHTPVSRRQMSPKSKRHQNDTNEIGRASCRERV